MEVKAVNSYSKKTDKLKIFLGGVIDMGKSENWQEKISKEFKDDDNLLLINPRRDDWDSSWTQEMENEEFREQVEWELDGLENADLILIVLLKDSKAPISLLELGIHAKSKKLLVFCEDGFYRKGNVDIVCNKYDIEQVDTLDKVINSIKDRLSERKNISENFKKYL